MNITGKLTLGVLAAVLAAGCSSGGAPASSSPRSTVTASAAPAQTLSPRQQFVTSYRQALAAEGQGSSATDAQVYKLGRLVCTARANGTTQASLIGIGGNATKLNKLAERYLCPQYG